MNIMIHSNGYLNPHIAESVRCIVRYAIIFFRLRRGAEIQQLSLAAGEWNRSLRTTLDTAKSVAKLR